MRIRKELSVFCSPEYSSGVLSLPQNCIRVLQLNEKAEPC